MQSGSKPQTYLDMFENRTSSGFREQDRYKKLDPSVTSEGPVPEGSIQKDLNRDGPFKRVLFGRISTIGSDPFYTGSPSNLFGKLSYVRLLFEPSSTEDESISSSREHVMM